MKAYSVAISVLVLAGLCACHSDDRSKGDTPPVPPPPAVDTVPQDLSSMHTSLPPAAPEPPAPRPRPNPSSTAPLPNYPPAPEPLMDAVKREQSVTRFCYQEYGQKADPQLRGSVALTVTIADNAVSAVSIAQSNWSSLDAGGPVNDCLANRARQAWHLDPGSTVAPGIYLVQLNFRGN